MDMNRIEEQARYYQNLPLRDRGVKAVVHLEELHIGTLFCHGTNVAFKTDILDKALHTEGYAEIDNVQSDLVKITSAQ